MATGAPSRPQPLVQFSVLVVLGTLYGLAATVGLVAAIHRGVVSPVWPAAGVGLWIVWKYGARAALAIGVALLVVLFPIGLRVPSLLGLSIAPMIEALLVVGILRRFRFDSALGRVRDVLVFSIAMVVVGPALCALLGVSALCATGDAPWSEFPRLVRTWWVGDALGGILLGAVLLTCAVRRSAAGPGSARERVTLFVAAVAVSWIIFADGTLGLEASIPLKFAVFPVVAWAALRFGPRETAITSTIMSVIATASAMAGYDTFGGRSLGEELVLVQFFIVMIALSGMVMAAVTTSLMRAERTSQDAASLLEATLDSTADGILVVDTGGRILTFNQRFADLWRIPREILARRDDREALGFALGQLKEPGAFIRKVEELYARPTAESFDSFELLDGRTFERFSMPQRADQKIVGRVWSFRDVTQQRRLEAELRQAHKMEAVGRLAGGVAHDFNNLLTVILGHADLLAQQFQSTPAALGDLGEIRKASERAATLTRQLLAFSRMQRLEPRVLDLNAVVSETETMLRRLIGEHIALVTDLEPGLGPVRADPGQMQQVVLNLALNARDAMPSGGRLALRTREVDVTFSRGFTGASLRPGRYIVLSVIDTGVGMDEAARAHIFEPFYTTKSVGRGTGLGLAMVYGIVRQSGGEVIVTSAPGEGAQFDIVLPRAAYGGAPEPPEPHALVELPRGTGSILLVEDNESVRSMLSQALRRAGYTLLVAANGREALELAAAHAGAVDLLVTDIVMPEMGGPELSRALRARFPELRVLFMSGYANDDSVREGGDGHDAYLQKPFTPGQLAHTVSGMLAGSSL